MIEYCIFQNLFLSFFKVFVCIYISIIIIISEKKKEYIYKLRVFIVGICTCFLETNVSNVVCSKILHNKLYLFVLVS